MVSELNKKNTSSTALPVQIHNEYSIIKSIKHRIYIDSIVILPTCSSISHTQAQQRRTKGSIWESKTDFLNWDRKIFAWNEERRRYSNHIKLSQSWSRNVAIIANKQLNIPDPRCKLRSDFNSRLKLITLHTIFRMKREHGIYERDTTL